MNAEFIKFIDSLGLEQDDRIILLNQLDRFVLDVLYFREESRREENCWDWSAENSRHEKGLPDRLRQYWAGSLNALALSTGDLSLLGNTKP